MEQVQEREINNRRKTNGRRIYFQMINANSEKGTGKNVIKHIQPSINRVTALSIMLSNLEKVVKEDRAEEKYKAKEGRTIWNSQYSGTYIKAEHGNIGRRKNGTEY